MSAESDDRPVPRIPRAAGRGFRPSASQLLKIGITAGVLVMVIVVQRPCADSVSGFVTSFDNLGSQGSGSGSAASTAIPKPDQIDPTPPVPPPPVSSEVITTDMTEEQTRAAIERVRARAEAERSKRAGSGSGAGSGSAR